MIFFLSLVKLGFSVFTLFNAYGSTFSNTPVCGVALVCYAAPVCGAALVCRAAALGSSGNFQV
jgi:hypothetical protein